MSTEDDKVIYEHVANDTELTEQPKIESLLNDKEYSNTHSMSVNDDQNDLPYQKPTLSNNDTFVIKTVDNIDNAESKEEIPILSPITCSSPSNGLDKYNSNEEIQMFSPTITGYNSAEYGSNHDMKYDPIKVIDIDEEDLPLPYKKGCFHKTKFRFKTFLIIHPRIYALYLLFIQTWPRILLVFDMYTDLVVAYELYQGEQRVWFMLSSLFFVLPFILVWFASLRFIQLYVQKLYDKLDVHSDKSTNNIIKSKNNIYSKLKKKSSLIHTVINIFLMIYMFPLIGSLFMAVAEVMWIISDVFHGFKAFVFGTGLIETENRQIKAMKSYRRTVEVFSESVPQSLLQFYIFIRLSIMEQTTENASYQGVSQNALYLSFGVSMVNLGYNFYRFKKEAQLHGMSWSEYSLSVLQLAEVPVIKLVPRTPAIKKGLITEANFAGFKFDKQSITPLLDAISDENSKLTTIKLSVASLSQLDAHSCKYLGNLLHHTGIKVLISRCSSLLDLKNLFQEFDIDHKGYITELEFFNALKTLNCSLQNDQKQKTFKKLAVRRQPQRDRIYWYDFFKITASVKKRNALKVAFDLTEIEYPMHFIFQKIQKLIKSNQPEKIELMNHFENLFQFNVGLGTLNKIDISSNNHVFYSIVDVHALLYETRKPYPYYARFVAKTFDKLLTSHIFDAKFYLRRNKIFLADDDDVKQKSSNSVRWVTKLQNDNKPGINIFEHCLLYSQCKLFARFLDVWLNKSDTRDIEDSINENGELYHLFYETNGFHLTDISEYTPLYYAVQHKLENVIEFYGKYVFKNEILLSKTDCKWLNDQKYLHKIVHDSLKTNSNVDLFKILLSSHIDLSEWFEDRPIAHNMIVYRSIYPNHKDYILECFEALKDFTDFKGSNILHYAAKWKDIDAAQLIVNLNASDKDEYLNKLLNQENELNMTPLKIAIWDPESDCAELAKLLMLNEHQKNIDYKIFASKLECATTQEQWIQCLYEMIIETDCYILNKISKDDKQDIFIKIYQIHEEELTENSKNNLYKNIKKITQQIRSIHRELKKHLDTTDIDIAACVKLNINDKPKRSFDKPRHSSSLARSLTNFGKKKHRSRSANSTELNEKQMQSDQNPLYIKDLYLKAISNHDNSCFGINHISPKDAAYVWLGIDLLFNMIKCFICISLGFWYDYRQRFELGLYPNVENYLYKAFSGCWIVICITNLLAIYGISKFSKTLLLLKLITFIIDIELTIFCAVMYLFLKQQTLTTSFMIICITFVSLNMLFTLFGFYDVYKIYKLIKRYSNGDYEDSMYGLDTDYISEHVYKIVNVNDPYLNGKHCEILLKLDEENYRVKLVNDTYSVGPSLRVIHKSNLKIEQDTQNKLFQNKIYNENVEHKTESDVLQSLDMNKLPMQKRSQYRANRICADFNTDKIWMGEVNVDNGRKGGKFGGKKRRSLNNVTINKNNIKRSERPKDIDKKNSNNETKTTIKIKEKCTPKTTKKKNIIKRTERANDIIKDIKVNVKKQATITIPERVKQNVNISQKSNSNNQQEHEIIHTNDFESNNIQSSLHSMFQKQLSLYENKYDNDSKLNEQTISDMEQIIDEEIFIDNSVPDEASAINDESVANKHTDSIIYYLAGGNNHTKQQNNSHKSNNQSNKSHNSNNSNNHSDKTNGQSSNNNGSNMSGCSGGDDGQDGNGRKDRNNNSNSDEDDEEENPEKDDKENKENKENEDDNQKDNESNSPKLNAMAAEFSPHTRKRSMTLSLFTINEQTPLFVTDSGEAIQSSASVPVIINERKNQTNIKSNMYQNKKKKKKKSNKKKLTFKQRKKLKLQQMYIRVNNQPYFEQIEPAKQNVYISQKLIRDIQNKTPTLMDNIRNYMNSVFEIHYQDKCESELKILDFGFVDKETKEALYCSLTPQNHSYDEYKLNDSLKLIKSLSSTHKFKSINIDHTNNIINAMKKVNTENILKNCDWDKIPIICRKDDKLRITASVTKEQLVIREKRFNANQINLIPIIGYNTKQVSFVWIIKIDTHIYIALSIGFEQQNNGINDITINGIYLDKSDLLIRHYLAYPPHMNECKCLNEFESIIDDINIGNPDLWFNKIKHYRASRKNNTNASYHHELKASMFETESEDSHNAIKRNSSSNSIVSSVSISKSTPNSSSVSSYDQQIMYQKSMISNDFYVNQTTANVPYIYVSTPIIPDMYNNNNNHHYHVFQHPHANNLYTNKNHFSNNSL